ncbi:YchJ family protein [Pseudomonas sp. OIL-1]|uniref:YchJ family protein n=1 Tax=Pseudomonas sp. OIL-1 TaxID=2706126 RepID=UPI0013A77B1A|nr:YchJ family protein [Pseudomonas sp. OIL-1]QIB51228.1 YchJ family protein [Pseudomonas sp. OIL-1]
MENIVDCPCGNGRPYADCCLPLHQGKPALTAEQLMRSRYSAYTLGLIDYLVATTLPSQQAQLDRAAMTDWSLSSNWLGLTVEKVHSTEAASNQAQVTFTAQWADEQGHRHSHRECSDFIHINARWYFVDPSIRLKTGRNEPCPCASGKKYKQCCGR